MDVHDQQRYPVRRKPAIVRRDFRVPIGWGEILKWTTKETTGRDCMSLAAETRLLFLPRAFPALPFLVALASCFPIDNLMDQ
jgi:hypothetical protein